MNPNALDSTMKHRLRFAPALPPRKASAGPEPRFPFPFFLKNARVFFKSVMEKRGEGERPRKEEEEELVVSVISLPLVHRAEGR